jgi:uncharacterized phage-associated protein
MARDPKLEAVLARLCQRLGGKVWKTQAVKLPYLVDLVGLHVLGNKITETRHEAWDMGVVATSAWSLIQHSRGGEYFRVEAAPDREDACQLALQAPPPTELSDEEAAIVDFVAEEYGHWPLDRLMTLTKLVNPDVDSWGPPSEQIVETEAAYKRLPLWFGEDEADVASAVEALSKIERDPERLIRGKAAEDFLHQLVS